MVRPSRTTERSRAGCSKRPDFSPASPESARTAFSPRLAPCPNQDHGFEADPSVTFYASRFTVLISGDRLIALRFPVALVLSIVCLAVPAWADFQAGMNAYNRGDYPTALREWRPLAEQGDARAQFYLGLSYENGDGVPRDHANAHQWYEKSAAQGDAKAQLYLGMQSSFGEGGPVDLVQAYMWYSLASGNGNAHAPGYRDDLTRQMTLAQIVEAKKRAREWKPKDK